MDFGLMPRLITHGYRMLRIIPRCKPRQAITIQMKKSGILRMIYIILCMERSFSMTHPILVTGAAGGTQGSTGRLVASLLLKQGIPVRALVHKLDARSDGLREQ